MAYVNSTIVCLTKTKLSDISFSEILNINYYQVYCRDGENQQASGGGVLVLMKKI